MDGFKLLEHIGLELDLPVISAHLTTLLTVVDFYEKRRNCCRQLEPTPLCIEGSSWACMLLMTWNFGCSQ